jgi:ribosomal protein S18 acetylase RimI-like enzyme
MSVAPGYRNFHRLYYLRNHMDVLIHRVNEQEYLQLAQIGRDTFYETWRSVNTEEDMQAYMAKAFDPSSILKDIQNKDNTFYIATLDSKPIGYCKLRRDRTYEEFGNDKVIELERIYVFREYHDKKVGKKLMDVCIALANEEKHQWLWLGVNIDNHKAIQFYKNYGFTIFGEKAFQLGDAVDNDYLMKLKLR